MDRNTVNSTGGIYSVLHTLENRLLMIKRLNLRDRIEYPRNARIMFGVNLSELLWHPKSFANL